MSIVLDLIQLPPEGDPRLHNPEFQKQIAVLRKPCARVTDFQDRGLQDLIDNLLMTMEAKKGFGLAAPQVGVSLRVFVAQTYPTNNYPKVPRTKPTVFINPVIQPLFGRIRPIKNVEDVIAKFRSGKAKLPGGTEYPTEVMREACLSLPGRAALVRRYSRVKCLFQDRFGNQQEVTWSGIKARVLQHETDHLYGRLISDSPTTEMIEGEPLFSRVVISREKREELREYFTAHPPPPEKVAKLKDLGLVM